MTRIGNSLVARTELGRSERVLIAGHVDTVPVNDNLPARNDGTLLHGLGTCDMKGGVAVALRLAATVTEPRPRGSSRRPRSGRRARSRSREANAGR